MPRRTVARRSRPSAIAATMDGRAHQRHTLARPRPPPPRRQPEFWLGEIEGLKVSLAGTEDKLAQIAAAPQRQEQAVHLGMPAFPDIAGRTVPAPADPGAKP